ncbi:MULTISPECIES: amino-acid N-acetyltransferase [Alteromonadaceae]|jgi:amino-acid N-acetyltransferase|uniref:Amino-acid acetyltransferase n=1 Tax=Brumicola blandensis TaxID=3075611 RepID=A0AAW8R1N5_9ALTE|nr:MULTISPECIES: amino-acid N-acetyltransferase [unclassified Alteromonas]MDT0582344.1 amino-acid N-acetyltransferase [Alteromonas sp. W409]MDT0628565.1 amino-acid N-acetyltransferase [Alteromonas sp. W364]
MALSDSESVRLFRSSAPYINAHRGKTFVIMFGGEAIESENFAKIIQDIALLNSLGVKLVIVHGARPQIEKRLAIHNKASRFKDGIRVTDKETLECVKDAAGSLRSQIEALLTMGLPNSPMHGSQIRVCSGNLVVAKPYGVQDGVDFENTGVVRRIDVQGLNDHLDDGSIVLLSPMGYSPTGEVFNLSHEDVATKAAIALKADKIITFSESDGIFNKSGKLLRTTELNTMKKEVALGNIVAEDTCLTAMLASVEAGVQRAHCVNYKTDGVLLKELFTRDGAGSLVLQNHYEQLRTATIDDVGGILKLIKPLEESGALVKRSRERLEQEIDKFTIIVRDGMIIACAALYLYPEDACGELACVATHHDYRGANRGERLLDEIRKKAILSGLQKVFVLTTVTGHWFLEQGFEEKHIEDLPAGKKEMYNFTRNSKVFMLSLFPN